MDRQHRQRARLLKALQAKRQRSCRELDEVLGFDRCEASSALLGEDYRTVRVLRSMMRQVGREPGSSTVLLMILHDVFLGTGGLVHRVMTFDDVLCYFEHMEILQDRHMQLEILASVMKQPTGHVVVAHLASNAPLIERAGNLQYKLSQPHVRYRDKAVRTVELRRLLALHRTLCE